MIAEPRTVRIRDPLPLECGRTLPSYLISYETYGTLSGERDNAILVCHSLTGNAHAAGRYQGAGSRAGWWDALIGPGKLLDTSRYFVICSDTLAAGHSTGPGSLNPATGRPWGLDFPVVTMADIVAAQRQLIEHLGIERLHAVIGGCFGGAQAAEWAIRYPRQVGNAVIITTTPATSAHTIAIFTVMRHLIQSDPRWNQGDYYHAPFPEDGLRNAVAAAVPLWMSREAMEARFGRRMAGGARYSYALEPEFEVETFIQRLARRARRDIDPNGLMYLMRAEEYFDLDREHGSLRLAFGAVTARVLFVSYRGDWRYPPAATEQMRLALAGMGGQAWHEILDSPVGHGAFLYEPSGLAQVVGPFLAGADIPRRAAS